jgi:hypothetical protein
MKILLFDMDGVLAEPGAYPLAPNPSGVFLPEQDSLCPWELLED